MPPVRGWRQPAHQHRCPARLMSGPRGRRRTDMTEDAQQASGDKTAIRPFQVGFPEADLAELRRRVTATRWPERETVTDDSQGARLEMMQDLARYWAADYDWGQCEKKLNALPNFLTEIDGLDIHFIHVRSQHED